MAEQQRLTDLQNDEIDSNYDQVFESFDDMGLKEDLLRGIIIQSGNDASIAIAEGLAGTEQEFAAEMTRRARELGMKNTVFMNSTGLPDPNQTTTARDLAILARHTMETFPEYYHFYSEKNFTYNGIRQGNRNPLLYKDIGVDGLKTGHTEESGYGLTASLKRNDRRLILVVNGLPNAKVRSKETELLLEWGLREFNNYALFKRGDRVAEAEIWLGESLTVPLAINQDLTITLPRKSRPEMKVSVNYQGPIPAPVAKGAKAANLKVMAPGMDPIVVPLIAEAPVERLGLIGRLRAAFTQIFLGGPA